MKNIRNIGLVAPYYFDEDDYKLLPLIIDDMEERGWNANMCVHLLGHQNYLDLINGV